ncbi:hypothetical protein [Nostoc sp.]|uniref:hypothetical protein n=1 Tax=Nostoc sp. TaxID=1180 RepID=UPI002FF68390
MLLENTNYRRKLSQALICCVSSSLLITSNVLPISALVKPQNSQDFIIAKSPDERQPEAVKKGIDQIPASQASVSPKRKTSIESPIQQTPSVSSNTENSQPTSSASNDSSTSRPSGRRASNSNSNRSNSGSASRSSGGSRISNSNANRSNAGSRRVPKANSNVATSRNQNIDNSALSSSMTPTYKEINFVDVALGISNFQGKKNQLVSIRVDSVDEEFSPYIALLNSQGQTIAIDKDKDKDGVYTALIDRARLPQDDTYYIVVTSKNPQERGKYRLTIF